MIEADRAREWILTTLRGDPTLVALIGAEPGDPTLGVHDGIVPEDVPYPAVVLSEASPGEDVATSSTRRVFTRPSYTVKAIVGGESYGPARPIADQIDSLLQNVKGTTSDATILSSGRLRPFSLEEESEGGQFRHLGGVYQIAIQETANG